MKTTIPFTIENDMLAKVDDLKFKRNASRSEALRHIVSEFFVEPATIRDLIDDVNRLKVQNYELKYQLQETTQRLIKQNKEMMTVLLVLCGQDVRLFNAVKTKLPHLYK